MYSIVKTIQVREIIIGEDNNVKNERKNDDDNDKIIMMFDIINWVESGNCDD